MTTPTERGLAEMRRVVVAAPDGTSHAERRERLAASFNRMAEQARARSRRRRLLARLLVAAVALLALGSTVVWRDRMRVQAESAAVEPPCFRVLRGRLDAGGTSHSAGALVGFGSQELAVGDEPADLSLPSGAVVSVAENTRLRVVHATRSGDEIVRLLTGRVSLVVPKLGEGSLQVVAPQATVTVHGTRFAVAALRDAAASYTTVTVTEGLVSVRSANEMVMLGAGGSWSSRAKATPPAQPDTVLIREPAAPPNEADHKDGPAETLAPEVSHPTPRTRAPVPGAPPPATTPRASESAKGDLGHDDPGADGAPKAALSSSPAASGSGAESPVPPAPNTTLIEENRLYQGAMHAKRNGMDELALQRLDELLLKFPSSPLAASARLERQRILQHLKQTGGRGTLTPP